ncbi:hypothetical protein NSMS1_39110 [Nostoc sp. MS1]|nr:hypothetical protein NSMS1_39110 [Nostoc sp. MS1]
MQKIIVNFFTHINKNLIFYPLFIVYERLSETIYKVNLKLGALWLQPNAPLDQMVR